MTLPTTQRILLTLIRQHGAVPIVVFDVDEFTVFTEHAGAAVGASALTALAGLFEKRAARCNGHVHLIKPDRFLVALPGGGYDEAVLFAERSVDDVRALAIPSSVTKPVVGPRLSVTAAVVSVESRADIERFWPRVNDLLRDGKSTGGDAIVRDR